MRRIDDPRRFCHRWGKFVVADGLRYVAWEAFVGPHVADCMNEVSADSCSCPAPAAIWTEYATHHIPRKEPTPMTDHPEEQKKILRGMHRPEWAALRDKVNSVPYDVYASGLACEGCGKNLPDQMMFREHWQSGHFDEPVYEPDYSAIEAPILLQKKGRTDSDRLDWLDEDRMGNLSMLEEFVHEYPRVSIRTSIDSQIEVDKNGL